jgi:hypothetical protein
LDDAKAILTRRSFGQVEIPLIGADFLNRRDFMRVLGLSALSGSTKALAAPTDLRAASREAWLFALPLIESARVRANSAEFGAGDNDGTAINSFLHVRRLATPADRLVTSPNVVTLYSLAFIDLENGPATVVLPPTGERYFSLQLMDMYTNTFAVLGTRTIGGDGGTFTLVGPREAAPRGAIRAPTPWIWALIRIAVGGPEDIDAVHKLQDAIGLKAGRARALGVFAQRTTPWREYFSSATALMAENPPAPTDLALLKRVAPLGLDAPSGFNAAKFSDAQALEIERGVADAKIILAGPGAERPVNGWRYPNADLGDFGQNYHFRARVALSGLAALPRQEAMYMRPFAPDGSPRFGDGIWRLSFPHEELPPVDAFWSLTLYQATGDGQLFLTENPLRRYAIGDRTNGLKFNGDGSLDIWIARSDPGGSKTSNWLPAPSNGKYVLTLRAYLPKSELLSGEYRLPPLVAG